MNKSIIAGFLQSIETFKYLDINAMKFIIGHGQLISCVDNEVVLTQGQLGSGLYILVNGKMAVTVRLLGKGIIKLATLSPGQFFGEVTLLENVPCTATVKSIGKTVYFLLKKSSFDMLHIGSPKIRYQISQALIEDVIQRQRIMTAGIKNLAKTVSRRKIDLNLHKIKLPAKKLELTMPAKQEMLAYLEDIPFFNRLNSAEFYQFLRMANVIELTNKYTLIKQTLVNQSCFFYFKRSRYSECFNCSW